jgi:hypothetical protein
MKSNTAVFLLLFNHLAAYLVSRDEPNALDEPDATTK